MERLQHDAPDHVGVLPILDGAGVIHLGYRSPPPAPSVVCDAMHEFRPLLDDAKRYAQCLADLALLIFGERIGGIGVAHLAAEAKRMPHLECRKNPAATR